MNSLAYADEFGTTKEDFLIGEEQSEQAGYLRSLDWEILDLIPKQNIDEVKEIIIDLIIEKRWDS